MQKIKPMLKMRITFAALAFIFLSGCISEPYSIYRATLFNNTSHSIKILCYKNGIVNGNDTIFLEPNASFQIAYGTTRGKYKGRGFSSGYFGSPEDSNVVVFDNIYRMVHYANTPVNLAKHYYLFDSPRNIANPNSYEFDATGNINDHKYYFTEQDYQDAKD